MKRAFSVVLVALMSLFAAACSSSGPADPSSPAAVGATIRGTVNPSVSAASDRVHAQSSGAGLQVTVVGSGLSTTTDGGGRFVLKGVPAGSVTLRFQGSGIDATLTLSGVADGQTLTITVHVSGSEASEGPEPSPGPSESPEPSPSPHHSPEPEKDAEFEGSIDSISLPTLVVSAQTIRTDSHTKVEGDGGGDSQDSKLTLADLKVGDKVDGKGTRQADGVILAREIQVHSNSAGEDSRRSHR